MVIALTLGWVGPTAALGVVHSATASDARDQPPALSGTPIPDIVGVHAEYDDALGRVATTVQFFDPVPSNFGIYNVSVSLGQPSGSSRDCYSFEPGGMGTFTEVSGSPTAILTATGYTGSLSMTKIVSVDGHSITLETINPGLAGRSVACMDADLTLYDEIGHCGNIDCTWWSHTYFIDSVDGVMFDGAPWPNFTPPPPMSSGSPAPTPTPVHVAGGPSTSPLRIRSWELRRTGVGVNLHLTWVGGHGRVMWRLDVVQGVKRRAIRGRGMPGVHSITRVLKLPTIWRGKVRARLSVEDDARILTRTRLVALG
jgi:hypothetical protein